MKTGNSNYLFVKRIPFEKGVFSHHVVHFVFLFSGPFYEITCYGGDRVHSGCTIQKILLCARDFKELTDSSQGFHRVLDYLYAWYINDAAWKSFPGQVTSLGHTEVSLYFCIEFFRSVNLRTQIRSALIECLETELTSVINKYGDLSVISNSSIFRNR